MVDVVPALKVGSRIGGGHFGEVFNGVDGVHDIVAVKVIKRSPGQDDAEWLAYKTAFLSEAQHLSKAKHANVVEVYHIQEAIDGESIQLCMALCAGGSLQEKYESGPSSLSYVRKIGTEVALGLEALHERGMLHRDIKPGNILLNAADIAQLGDFGLVTDNLILGYGSQVGYSDHIAHEVWHGKGTSRKSDIWALGMTLYRLLHGKEWYERSPAPRTVVAHGNFVDRLEWLPHIPKPWRRVIRKMMSDDPNGRYQSAGQVLSALGKMPTTAWSSTVLPDAVRWEKISTSRRKVVLWELHPKNGHKWSAWSEPLAGIGRIKNLDGSKKLISKKEAINQLTEFLGK